MTHFQRLSRQESDIVKEVLRAAADGPFFPEWEFQTLFGIARETVRSIADEWPLPKAPPRDVLLAVNNSFNSLLGYPHRKHNAWSDWISVDQRAANELLSKLRKWRNESEPHKWIDVQVVHGPVALGDNIVRAIEAKDNRGGTLRSIEKWSDGQWVSAQGVVGGATCLNCRAPRLRG